METICPNICSISRPWSAKSPLPFDMRRSQTSLLNLWDQPPQWGKKAKKKNRRGSETDCVDAEDCRRSRSQTPHTNVPIYSSKRSLRRGDVSLLRETERSLVEFQILWKPDVRDYMREELRDNKTTMLASSSLAFTGSQFFHTYNFSYFLRLTCELRWSRVCSIASENRENVNSLVSIFFRGL